MRIDTTAETRGDYDEYVSPFAALSPTAEPEAAEYMSEEDEQDTFGESPFEGMYTSESPFGDEYVDEADLEAEAAHEVFEEMYDEEFEDALESLLDEGAAHLAADAEQWQVAPSESEMHEALDQWIAPVVSEWERLVDDLAAGLDEVDVAALSEDEADELIDSLVPPVTMESAVFDEFFGKLVRKVKNVAKSAIRFARNPVRGVVDLAKKGVAAVKSGIQAVGKHLIGPILRKLKSVGLALLKGVVAKLVKPLTRVLPAPLRPVVPVLMRRLGIRESAEGEIVDRTEAVDDEYGTATLLAEAFDAQLVGLFFTPEPEFDTGLAGETFDGETFDEGEFDGQNGEYDPVAELDVARERLANQLVNYTGSEPPVAEIEQFVPAVLAVRPLLKLGLTVTGARSKLIDLVSRPLAGIIRNALGKDAIRRLTVALGKDPARTMARAVTGVGFTALGLEANESADEVLAGEALASAVEATVLRVADELSDEAYGDPLQVSAAVQQAFAEAAAAYLPDGLLRADLPERETADEGGLWILMPRAARPRYRYRKYTKVFPVSVTRQVARSVPWSDGGTLEGYLLDRGVTGWPVHAEVDLYETLPGTLPGHLTHDETLPLDEQVEADEFQLLTTEVAGTLLREPALGRPMSSRSTRRRRPGPGQRFYRVRVGRAGRALRRPRRLLTIRWHPSTKRLRVIVRLSERRVRALQSRLQRSAPSGSRDLPAVLSSLRGLILPQLQRRLARRLVKAAVVPDQAAATTLAGTLSAASMTALSTFLAQSSAQFAAAVADPANGVAVTITFPGVTATGPAGKATVEVRPGWRNA